MQNFFGGDTVALPKAFLSRMRDLLGGEFQEYLACMERPAFRGVRWNPIKCDFETLRKSVPIPLMPTAFSPLCFYGDGLDSPGTLPAHHAGMFYSQEPSASCAVTVLAPQPGERVLDLCAAPGGKSTQIVGLLRGRGLLWANEVIKGRTGALLSNLERMGAGNAVVSSCKTEVLCTALSGFFDRVLVDAPCSGEGMFRRDPAAVKEWTPESPAACARRQRAILEDAALALKPGGVLVYSTCTFSPEENEGVICGFLQNHPEFEPVEIQASFGRPGAEGQAYMRRVFPMDGGEGHFVSCLRKTGGTEYRGKFFSNYLRGKEKEDVREFYGGLFEGDAPELLCRAGNRLYLLPEGLPELAHLGVLRAGVELGEQKPGRIEPSHGLYMSREKAACRQALEFSPDDPALLAYLKGEEIDCVCTGYTAVCVNKTVTGFGKAGGGRLKNRYPKGLRNY